MDANEAWRVPMFSMESCSDRKRLYKAIDCRVLCWHKSGSGRQPRRLLDQRDMSKRCRYALFVLHRHIEMSGSSSSSSSNIALNERQ